MKILLFNVPISFNSWQNTEPPMGVSYIASLLKSNGHDVEIMDYEVERFSRRQLEELVTASRPDIAGLSFRTPSFASANTICSVLKTTRPSLPVVLGGPHTTAFPEEAILESGADMAVRGDGEFAMLEILNAIDKKLPFDNIRGLSYRADGAVHHNEGREHLDGIDVLPWPARELLPMGRYNIDVVLSSRGCPYSCVYCDKVVSSRKVKYRSAEDVMNEIVFIKEKYKKHAFYFIDEHFLSNKARAEQITDLMLKLRKDKGVSLKWVCQSRVDAVDKNILRKIKEAGCCEIHYGLETGDPTELAFINKRTTLKQAEEAVHLAKECGLRIRGNFMIGFPVSTHVTIQNTIRFAAKLPVDKYRFFIVSPLPNTKMWDYILANKQLQEDFDWQKDHFLSPALKIPGIDKEALVQYIGAAYLHALKKDILKELLPQNMVRGLVKISYLIAKTRKMRGDKFSVYFPKVTNLFLEMWLLLEGLPLKKKVGFIRKIMASEKRISRAGRHAVSKPLAKKMEEFYQTSEAYFKELQTVANKGHYSPYFKYVNRYAAPPSRLLDMGCGLGVVPYYFSQEGFDTYGVDISLKFLSYAGSAGNPNLHYVSGNVFGLPFKDGAFDIVGNYDVLEHVPDAKGFLNEGIRVLKNGGIFVIICPSILTPFTPLKAIFSLEKSHSVYTSRLNAFARIFVNLYLIYKKKISARATFYYRQPVLNDMAWRRETDTAYQTSPIDLKRFLEAQGMEVLHWQNDGPSMLHRFIGKVLPDLASTIYIVARKRHG